MKARQSQPSPTRRSPKKSYSLEELATVLEASTPLTFPGSLSAYARARHQYGSVSSRVRSTVIDGFDPTITSLCSRLLSPPITTSSRIRATALLVAWCEQHGKALRMTMDESGVLFISTD